MAEDRIGKRIAEFEIVDTDGDNWTSIGIKKDGSQWIYESEDKYNRFCNGCIYRPLSCNEGYVHIKINFQQESEPWAAINVFLTDDEENILLGDNEYICRFGNFIYDGVSLYYSGKKEEIKERVDNTSDDETIGSVCRRISYNPGTGNDVYNKCIKNNLVEAIQFLCSKDRIFGFGATPSRHEKSLRILGMVVHLAADKRSYRHTKVEIAQ